MTTTIRTLFDVAEDLDRHGMRGEVDDLVSTSPLAACRLLRDLYPLTMRAALVLVRALPASPLVRDWVLVTTRTDGTTR